MSQTLIATLGIIALGFLAIVLGHLYSRGRRGGGPGVAEATVPEEPDESLFGPAGEDPIEPHPRDRRH